MSDTEKDELIEALKEALDESTTVLRSMADHAEKHGFIIEAMYARNIANLYGKPEE